MINTLLRLVHFNSPLPISLSVVLPLNWLEGNVCVCVCESVHFEVLPDKDNLFQNIFFSSFFLLHFRISFIGCNKQILTLLLRALFTPSTVGSAHSFTHSPFFFAYFCFWVPSLLHWVFPNVYAASFPSCFFTSVSILWLLTLIMVVGGEENESVRECILCWWEGANVGCFSYKFFVNHTHFLVCVRDATVNTIVHF